jgi:hypothetical protein
MQADDQQHGSPETALASGADEETHPIVYRGRLVALAGPRRCYFLVDDLEPAEMRFVAAMCLCSREVREGRLPGPFTSELAERWARIFVTAEARFRQGVP